MFWCLLIIFFCCLYSPSGVIRYSFAASYAHPPWQYFRHHLVSVNNFHIGRYSPLTVVCSLTLILSFLPAFCLLLRPGALWELSRVHLVEGPSPESGSCMNRYFNFHSLLSADFHFITTPVYGIFPAGWKMHILDVHWCGSGCMPLTPPP